MMEPRFKIFRQQHDDKIHLELTGDFTDMSLCDLIDELKHECRHGRTVFVDTRNIKSVSISGFGRDVFSRNLSELNNASSIMFTGSSASAIMPRETQKVSM
ncbi:MAG: hypothetical protein SWH61_01425 [Thermodesulfobacteriota bacterium]|nr:hypothetical protein [Thermodesulfobacteriota bacterium]